MMQNGMDNALRVYYRVYYIPKPETEAKSQDEGGAPDEGGGLSGHTSNWTRSNPVSPVSWARLELLRS